MRSKIYGMVALLFLVGSVLFWPAQSEAQTASLTRAKYRQGELIVRLRAGENVDKYNSRYGTYTLKRLRHDDDFYLIGLQAGADVDRTLKEMAKDRTLHYAVPNYNYQSPEVRQTSQAFIDQTSQAFIDGSSPVNFYGQSSVVNLRIPGAHVYGEGAGIKVAVIDTGIDQTHPLFAGRIGGPVYDFVNEDVDPNDEPGGDGYGHGTFVAGLIALSAPQAQIMPLRAFDSNGVGTSYNIARAIRFAVDNGAKVINMSFGMLEPDPFIRDAIEYAYGRAFMVAAAGNDNQQALHFPASIGMGRTLAVTSLNSSEVKTAFANFHTGVSVSAPGENVYSAYPGNRWAYWSGTSFSTALVSGEAAILLGINPYVDRGNLALVISTSGLSPNPFNPSYQYKLGPARVDFQTAAERILWF